MLRSPRGRPPPAKSSGHYGPGTSSAGDGGGYPQAPAAAAAASAHSRSHSSPSAASEYDDKRALSTATQIIADLEFGMPAAVVAARMDQLRLLVESSESIFPVWGRFEHLAGFCAGNPTSDPAALTAMLLLLRAVLDTSRLSGGSDSRQFAQNALNVPTMPGVFMACLRLLPVAAVSAGHVDRNCRQVARAALQSLLVFTRDAPSAVLHRLGILASQQTVAAVNTGGGGGRAVEAAAAGTQQDVRRASARVLFEMLCTGTYWPQNQRPPRFDDAEFYSAIRALVSCLGDPDGRVVGTAEDGLALLRTTCVVFVVVVAVVAVVVVVVVVLLGGLGVDRVVCCWVWSVVVIASV